VAQPVILIDYQTRTASLVGGDPTQDRTLADLLAAQRTVPSTASGLPQRDDEPPETE